MNYEKEGKGRPGRTRRRSIANRSLLAAIIVMVSAASTFAQTTSPLRMDSIPVGLQPLGIDGYSGNYVVANSGENSVSVISLVAGLTSPTQVSGVVTTQGIPSPYAVAFCSSGNFALVTSPSYNSVTVLPLSANISQRTIKVGSQPYSVACFPDPLQANQEWGVVSNLGDNTLTVFDPQAGTIVATISGVPGSRGFHGIGLGVDSPGRIQAWIAGADANVVTAVDLTNFRVLVQIPVSSPTAISPVTPFSTGSPMLVASAGSNNITAYNIDTAQVDKTPALNFANVPNPLDILLGTGIGIFATIGGQNALWYAPPSGASPSIISGIPGAAALAAYNPHGNVISGLGAVLVTSTNSNSIFLLQPQPPLPNQFSVSNGASFATSQEAAGSLVSAFVSTGASQISNAASLPLPNSLGGFALSVGGSLSFSATTGWTYSSTGSSQAGMLFVGPSQINFQIPPGIAPGTAVAAELTEPNGTTLLTTLNVTATAPGIFSVLQNGQGQGAVLNQDNSHNGNPQSLVSAEPAARGSVIQIYATGAGATTPTLMPGAPAPASGNPLVLTNVQPTVTIGGVPATVTFSGMAPGYVGLWQINAVVPQSVTPGLAVPLVISAGGATSNTVTIAVQ